MEAARGEANWRADSRPVAVGRPPERARIVGLARSLRVEGRPTDERHLESIWVEPRHRRTGVMRAILRYLAETGAGCPGLAASGSWTRNTDAHAVYERLRLRTAPARRQLLNRRLRPKQRSASDVAALPGQAPLLRSGGTETARDPGLQAELGEGIGFAEFPAVAPPAPSATGPRLLATC